MKYFKMPQDVINSHRDALARVVLDELQKVRKEYKHRIAYKEYLDCLINKKLDESIVILPIEKLSKIVTKVETVKKRHPKTNWNELMQDLRNIFSYKKKFYGGKIWNTATYIAMMRKHGLQICPYCNESEIVVSQQDPSTNNTYKGPLDHFYGNDEVPYLALSIFNLIPVCDTCNNKKNEKGNGIATYTHPFWDDFHALVRFKIVNKVDVEKILNRDIVDEITFKTEERSKRGRFKEALKLAEDVKLDLRYNGPFSAAKRSATEILTLCEKYPKSSVDWLYKFAEFYNTSLKGAFAKTFMVAFDASDINARQHGKLRYDLIPQKLKDEVCAISG